MAVYRFPFRAPGEPAHPVPGTPTIGPSRRGTNDGDYQGPKVQSSVYT